jgi:hypothetical protein
MMSSQKAKPFGAAPSVALEPDFNATNSPEFGRPFSFSSSSHSVSRQNPDLEDAENLNSYRLEQLVLCYWPR